MTEQYLYDIPHGWTAELAFGASAKAEKWSNKPVTLEQLKEALGNPANHAVGPKDGRAVLQGTTTNGGRKVADIRDLRLVVLDIDGGTTLTELREKVRAKGLACAIYTTHSHSAVKDKFRAVFVLAQAWTADMGEAKWKAAYRAFCGWLGVTHDTSCEDVARLFYLPRHTAGAPFHAEWIDGQAVDIFALPGAGDVTDAEARPSRSNAAGKGGNTDDLGGKLYRWAGAGFADAFLIADFIEAHTPERLRPEFDREFKRHVECAFEHEHTTPGGGGTFVMNAGDGATATGFVVMCQHSHCHDRDRLDHLAEIMEAAGLGFDALCDENWYLDVNGLDFSELEAIRDGKPTINGPAELKRVNEEFALVVMKDKIRILREVPGQPEPNFLPVEGFHQLLANRKMEITTEKKVKGKTETMTEEVPVSKLWMAWEHRRQYDGVAFEPNGVKGNLYNRWTGLPIKLKPGDWSLLRGHIHDNVCRGNENHFRWLMSWFAQIVQQPGEKLGSAIVIKGKKGAGKSKVLDWFHQGLGKYAIKVSDPKHLVGNFNAHHETALLLTAEEGFFAGDKRAEGRLKDLITSNRTIIERKGVDPYEVSNFTRLAITSNEGWVVPATIGERRYLVLECGDGRLKDTEFFAAVDAQMKTGGLEAMFYELANWPLGEVDLRNPPQTEGLRAQIFESLPPEKRFFVEMVLNGGVVDEDGYSDFEWPDENSSLTLEGPERDKIIAAYGAYLSHFPGVAKYQSGAQQFGKHAKETLPGFISDRKSTRSGSGVKGVKKVNFCTFPPLVELRAHCAENYGIDAG